MAAFSGKEYKIFELFKDNWAVVTAGTLDYFNEYTASWGTFGTLWDREGSDGQVITVFAHPARYTTEFLLDSEFFTVSFFPKDYRPALGYIGSHSGRDEDKIKAVGFTPFAMGGSVGYEEAELTFLCRKVYQNHMSKDGIIKEIEDYYRKFPEDYPPDENGEWTPHWMFIGEIVDVIDKR